MHFGVNELEVFLRLLIQFDSEQNILCETIVYNIMTELFIHCTVLDKKKAYLKRVDISYSVDKITSMPKNYTQK